VYGKQEAQVTRCVRAHAPHETTHSHVPNHQSDILSLYPQQQKELAEDVGRRGLTQMMRVNAQPTAGLPPTHHLQPRATRTTPVAVAHAHNLQGPPRITHTTNLNTADAQAVAGTPLHNTISAAAPTDFLKMAGVEQQEKVGRSAALTQAELKALCEQQQKAGCAPALKERTHAELPPKERTHAQLKQAQLKQAQLKALHEEHEAEIRKAGRAGRAEVPLPCCAQPPLPLSTAEPPMPCTFRVQEPVGGRERHLVVAAGERQVAGGGAGERQVAAQVALSNTPSAAGGQASGGGRGMEWEVVAELLPVERSSRRLSMTDDMMADDERNKESRMSEIVLGERHAQALISEIVELYLPASGVRALPSPPPCTLLSPASHSTIPDLVPHVQIRDLQVHGDESREGGEEGGRVEGVGSVRLRSEGAASVRLACRKEWPSPSLPSPHSMSAGLEIVGRDESRTCGEWSRHGVASAGVMPVRIDATHAAPQTHSLLPRPPSPTSACDDEGKDVCAAKLAVADNLAWQGAGKASQDSRGNLGLHSTRSNLAADKPKPTSRRLSKFHDLSRATFQDLEHGLSQSSRLSFDHLSRAALKDARELKADCALGCHGCEQQTSNQAEHSNQPRHTSTQHPCVPPAARACSQTHADTGEAERRGSGLGGKEGASKRSGGLIKQRRLTQEITECLELFRQQDRGKGGASGTAPKPRHAPPSAGLMSPSNSVKMLPYHVSRARASQTNQTNA
jgi:hypothetical protein